MINALLAIPYQAALCLCSFWVIFLVRLMFVQRKATISVYHVAFFLVLFFHALAGGGAQNDGYKRLQEFIAIEKNNQLDEAKKHPEKYSNMLQIDLGQFNNSDEFKEYLKGYDSSLDIGEAIFIGWLLALLADISLFVSKVHHSLLSRRGSNRLQETKNL